VFIAVLEKQMSAMSSVDTSLRIVNFSSVHRESFRELNERWISEYFTLEDVDREMLSHPEEYILDRGGYIFIALYEDHVAGTCALIKSDNLTFELAKMAVSPQHQGKGVGWALGLHCIELAKTKAIRKIELFSNTLLAPAIQLYKKLGFCEVPLLQTKYKRANIKMELDIQLMVKAVVVVAEDLPVGLAINAAALVTSTFGNQLSHLIGHNVSDHSGLSHSGLTWLPFPILKAGRDTLNKLHTESHAQKLHIVDIPEAAQMARVYEDFSYRMSTINEENMRYLAVGIYGDKSKVVALTRKLTLYK
jgi:GNAT superfamily N-acetyltransferase